MLETAIRHSKNVVFSFTCDGEQKTSDTELFANIKKEIAFIKAIAAKYAVKVNEPLILNKSWANSPELVDLEAFLRGGKVDYKTAPENIKLCPCMTTRDEAEYVANEICRQVRQEGRRFKDFVIITGSGANLDKTVASVMKKYNVPCFVSKNKLLCDLPIARFIISALSAIKGGYNTEEILAYLKSGLTDITDDEINDLENYVYLWSINGKKWFCQWDMSPYGIEDRDVESDEIKKILNRINDIRNRTITPLKELEVSMHGNATDMVKALFGFITRLGTAEKLKEYTELLESQGEYNAASYQSTSWDKLITVLDRITNSLFDTKFTFTRFVDILRTAFAAETVGEIPQRTDEVIFGTADRLRPLRPAVVFVMSANIGVFPAGISNSGIFTLAERNEMERVNAPLPDRYLAAATEQNYLFYTALCSATDKVYITYSKMNGGAELKPSAEVSKIRKAFGFETEEKAKVYSLNKDLLDFERPGPAFSYIAMNKDSQDVKVKSLRTALEQTWDYSDKLKVIDRATIKSDSISSEIAQKLYGNNMYLSASKLENFYSCPFSYFCKYGLKATPKRKARLDSMIRGTVAHYVFEKVLEKYQGNYAALDSNMALVESNAMVDEYFDSIGADKENLDAPSRYALSCLSEIICEVLTFVAKDFAKNEFKPAAFELAIGNNCPVSPLQVSANKAKVNITGKIDRVDISPIDDATAVRIVDYKSSAKAFNLAHVLEGRNMQMLIYLCAIIESQIKIFDSPKPAGILYLQALPGAKQDDFTLKPSAFLTNHKETLLKMDKDLAGEFIPVKATKTGNVDKRAPVINQEDFDVIFKFVKQKIADMANSLLSGNIAIEPISVGGNSGCKYCDFRSVCGKEKHDPVKESEYEKFSKEQALEKMKEEVSN